METREGEVQYIRDGRKSFKIEDIWYNNQFKELPGWLVKGSNIKVNFITKKDKNYWQSVLAIPKEKSNSSQEIEEIGLTATDKNCILMTAKDLALEFKNIPFNEWAKEVKRVRDNL